MRTARAAIVASGTATLEACLLRCPMVITYKVSPLTYLIGKLLVKVDYLGIVNIVAGREVCPELLQHRATPPRLADAVEPLISEDDVKRKMVSSLVSTLFRGDAGALVSHLVRDSEIGTGDLETVRRLLEESNSHD